MFSLSGSCDPIWRSLHSFSSSQLPRETRHWLLDESSLTQRLVDASNGAFRVQRLRQHWHIPLPSERRLLKLSGRQLALVREVALLCSDESWVFARSVIPAASLTGSLRHLRQLQNQSLGALIFQNPRLERSPFELSLLPGNSAYIHPCLQQPETAWARRSRFVVQNRPLLVSEVFLRRFRPWPVAAR